MVYNKTGEPIGGEMEFREGVTIEGHALVSKIGTGHYAEVWRAHYLGQPVAVKFFQGHRKIALVRREGFAQYALGHLAGDEGRFFPRVEHLSLETIPAYMRLELIEGRTLEECLKEGDLSLQKRLHLGEQILEALATVHRHGFVHGDLSPSNVFLTSQDGIKLIDVGYGQLFEEDEDLALSQEFDPTSSGVAAPLYAAPERFTAQFSGCGPAADIFSFGKVFYRLMANEHPHAVKPLSRKNPALGSPWDDFLFTCLEENTQRRFPDGSHALERYRHLCSGAQTRHTAERLECLLTDGTGNDASAAPSGDVPDLQTDGIEFLPSERAKKNCVWCGKTIFTEAKKCRHCGALISDASPEGSPASPFPKSFAGHAVLTLLGYFAFWLPGLIMNLTFLDEAKRMEQKVNIRPEGMGILQGLLWVFCYLPLAGLAAVMLTILTFAIMGLGRVVP